MYLNEVFYVLIYQRIRLWFGVSKLYPFYWMIFRVFRNGPPSLFLFYFNIALGFEEREKRETVSTHPG